MMTTTRLVMLSTEFRMLATLSASPTAMWPLAVQPASSARLRETGRLAPLARPVLGQLSEQTREDQYYML